MYGILFADIKNITHTNVTTDTMAFQGSHFVTYGDLSKNEQQLIQDDVKWDMELYNDLLPAHL
jgi:hypothetical protein